MKFITINNVLYLVKRTFKDDGWFGQAVQQFGADEILQTYHCEKLIKNNQTNEFLLVNEVPEAEVIEYIKNE
jgi:hypothetical protein